MKKLCIALLVVLMIHVVTRASVIYDVDFEAPLHTNNASVTVNTNNDTPSGTLGGTVIVRTGLADMVTQVASLEPAGSMSFRADEDINAGVATLSWDLAFISTTTPGFSSVSILLGADSGPSIQLLYSPDPLNEILVDGGQVGSFTAGQSDHFLFSFNLDADVYDLTINGSPALTSEPIDGAWALRTVSFGHPSSSSPDYAIDNFHWEIIPEPATGWLVAVGLALFFKQQGRNRRRAG